MNDQLAKPLFRGLHGSGDWNAKRAANDRLLALRRTLRGRAGPWRAASSSAVALLVAVVCLLCNGPACFGQSAPPSPARSAPTEDSQDRQRAAEDALAGRLKALDEMIAQATREINSRSSTLADLKALATDFEAYKVAVENSAASCREASDELEKLRRKKS
ncbi:MAG: hypothetical protein QOD09_2136 [Bradyrhizobium sp.]|jgi:hypothetical protein|nr:hypothetical protein [Bradyrhizobium sp.]